jgi:butyrate kinase
MAYRILVINPGSTSTKVAVFDGEEKLFQETLRYSTEDLKDFNWIMDQVDFRRASVEKMLAQRNIAPSSLQAICARGGMLPPCPSGAFRVDQDMVDYMYGIVNAAHASNIGCVIAYGMAQELGIPAFVYDPVAVDEMPPEARITGLPELPRHMMGHALNTRAMAIRCAKEVLHKPFDECRLIVLHLGGGASVRLFIGGKMVDNVRDDELLFAPERCGGLDAQGLVHLCFSGKYSEKELMKFVRGKGGLVAHLGTSDAMEVEKRIEEGDEKAKMVYDAMLYTAAKSIGALAAAADGQIDRVILTGGIAHSPYVTDYLIKKVSYIAPVEVMAGEFEMEALAAGACRVLGGEEKAHDFRELLKK